MAGWFWKHWWYHRRVFFLAKGCAQVHPWLLYLHCLYDPVYYRVYLIRRCVLVREQKEGCEPP